MIVADENIPEFIIKSLRGAGIEGLAIIESARGINDQQVIELALQNDYLLLTEDKDFGEWVFAHHVKEISVIFLRYSFNEVMEITQVLINLIKTKSLIRPFFATITTQKIRVRQL
jgi:predicted nuclease of predicted toxin-antitoxin system